MADKNDDEVVLPGYVTAPASAEPATAASADDAVALPAYADQKAQDKNLAAKQQEALKSLVSGAGLNPAELTKQWGLGATDKATLDSRKATFNQLFAGLGDDLRAAVPRSSWFPEAPEGATWADRRRTVHAERKAYDKEEHPGQWLPDLGANLLGGGAIQKALGIGVGAVAPKLVDYVKNAEGILPKLTGYAGNVGVGGLFGAAGEMGKADPGHELEAAKDGVAPGAGIAAILGPLTGLGKYGADRIGKFVSGVTTNLGGSNLEKLADSAFVKQLDAAGMTPAQYAQAIKDASVNGIDARGVDVLPDSVRGITKKILSTSGDAAAIGDSVLGGRANEMPNLVMKSVAKHVSPLVNTNQELEAIANRRAAEAAPEYAKAFAVPTIDANGVANKDVHDLFSSNELMQDVMRNAALPLRKAGTPMQAAWIEGGVQPAKLPPTMKMVEVPGKPGTFEPKLVAEDNPDAGKSIMQLTRVPALRDMHTMKVRIDNMIDKTRDPISGRMNGTATFGGAEYDYSQLKAAKDKLVGLMDKLTTDPATGASSYANARKIFSSHSALEDAMNHGAEVMKNRPEVTAMTLRDLGSEAERDAMLAGMAGHLTDLANKNGGTEALVNRLLYNPYAKENLKTMMDPVSYKAFIGDLSTLARMHQSNRLAKGGNIGSLPFLESANNERDLLYGMSALAMGHPLGAVAAAGRGLMSKAGDTAQKAAPYLANRHLMGADEAATFAQDHARRQNNPIRAAGRGVTGALSMMYDGIPTTAANLLGQSRTLGESGGLSTYLNTQE